MNKPSEEQTTRTRRRITLAIGLLERWRDTIPAPAIKTSDEASEPAHARPVRVAVG